MSQRIIDSLTRSRVLNNPGIVENTPDLDQGNRRRRRVPDMAVGLALIAVGVIGSLLVYQSASETVQVVGVTRSLERGHAIEANDLKALYVSPESAQHFVPGTDASELVGKILAVSVSGDSPLSKNMVSASLPLGDDEALTAAAIPLGNIPAQLAANDVVRLVLTPDATIASAAPPMLFDQAVTIWAIEQDVDLNNSVVVTFRGPLRLSLAIASAGNVRISRVNQ